MGKKENRLSALSKVGVFSAFALLATIIIWTFSPVAGTFATTDGAGPDVYVDVGSAISLSIDTNDLTMNANINSFVHGAVTLSLTTNSQYGYTLSMEDADANTNMVHIDSGVTDVISSDFTGSKTSSTMADNKWGFSVDNGSNYYAIPPLGLSTLVTRSDSPATTAVTKAVDFGVKVGVITAGTYRDTVIFTAYTNGVGGLPESGTGVNALGTKVDGTMQGFSCSTLSVGDVVSLKDTRDNYAYKVVKMADGKCWMAENLHIINRTLTSSDTDISNDFTLNKTFSVNNMNRELEQLIAENPTATEDEINNLMLSYSLLADKTYGGYYASWAAYGGIVNFMASNASIASTGNGLVTTSICPKNWGIPSLDDYQDLGDIYGEDATPLLGDPFNLLFGGEYYIHVEDGEYSFLSEGIGELGHLLTSNVVNGNPQVIHYTSEDIEVHDVVDGEFVTFRCLAD